MALIDSSIYRNAPRSLLREGLDGYDRGQQANDQATQRRAQEQARQQQMQAEQRKQLFNKNLSSLLGNYGEYASTPEGQRAVFQEMAKAGFGNEMATMMGVFPIQEKAALPQPPSYQQAETDQGMAAFNPQTGAYGAPAMGPNGQPLRRPQPAPTEPSAYQKSKDEWERKFRERQQRATEGNISKDNELAATKAELTRQKTEAEMARKAVDVPEMEAKADAAISMIDQMIGSEDGSTKRHPGFSGAVGVKGPSSLFGLKSEPIGGTDAADFAALYEQVKGGAFMEAVQSMKGTGALSDAEGKAAAGAITRMKTSQSEGEFIKAANEFRTAIKNRKGRVMAKAAPAAPAPGKLVPGTVEDGYKFKGGDPANPANWAKWSGK